MGISIVCPECLELLHKDNEDEEEIADLDETDITFTKLEDWFDHITEFHADSDRAIFVQHYREWQKQQENKNGKNETTTELPCETVQPSQG